MVNATTWTLEDDVNDWVKKQLESIGLVKNKTYTVESSMSPFMKEALQGSAKTENKTNFGKPDFQIEGYDVPVIFEDKLHTKKLIAETKDGIKLDDKSVSNYAVNGGLFYAQNMITSGKYEEVIVVGVAGDSEENVLLNVYYVFGSSTQPKLMLDYKTLDFLESTETFNEFLDDARLSEAEKHKILITTQAQLQKQAKALNVLMNNHNITAAQRVVYVSGALLAMQEVVTRDGRFQGAGLTPEDLQGSQMNMRRDGELIVNQISNYLDAREIPTRKLDLMMNSFVSAIQNDDDRDKPTSLDKNVSKLLSGDASVNKQVFTFIYENIFKSIDGTTGHLDIMGEMYSEFLKYALSDGKGIGIVLTPPYVTKMMTQILDVGMNSRVMDLATGSAGFLIASMAQMVDDANATYGRGTTKANEKIKDIKENQLLGVELNAQMFTLAATNMILRGDGSSHIEKGDTFQMEDPNLYADFKPDRLLLNPPFSYRENGMPFIEYGLRYLEKGGKAAIIIQDSAGSGKAIETNKAILKRNTLLASIKMPTDLFQPSAGVQTSIYVFEAGVPHDFDATVRFIDFRDDGYKRTGRGITEIGNPVALYETIVKVFKAGVHAKLGDNVDLWDLSAQVVDDQITDAGNDWNFEQHQVIDYTPTEEDFMKTVGDYLSWEVSQLLKAGE